MGKKTAQAALKTARDACKGTNTVYALEKNGGIDMVRIVFKNKKDLKKFAIENIKNGFKVHYTMV